MRMRRATLADAEPIERIMKESMAGLGVAFYDDVEVASAVAYIARVDLQIIEDGTYFIVEDGHEPVACGGWSRRGKLFTGSGVTGDPSRWLDPATEPARVRAMFVRPGWARRGIGRMILARCENEAHAAGFPRVALMATLPGEPLYAACGYVVRERVTIDLPDGTSVGGAHMDKSLV